MVDGAPSPEPNSTRCDDMVMIVASYSSSAIFKPAIAKVCQCLFLKCMEAEATVEGLFNFSLLRGIFVCLYH